MGVKADLATFLATFCKVRRIRHLGVARAFASRYPLAARIVSQLGEKFFKADTQLRHLGHFASHGIPTSGPVAQYSELAADFPELTVNDRDVAGLRERGWSLQSIIRAGGRFCPGLSLLAKSRFPAIEIAADGDSLRARQR